MNQIDSLKKRMAEQDVLMEEDKERKKARPNQNMADQCEELFQKSQDFWCDVCQEDITSSCYKTQHRMDGDVIAVWRTKCPWCDKELVRHITHRDEDLFYNKSKRVRFQRAEYATDALQADEWGFNSNYGNPYQRELDKREGVKQRVREGIDGLKGLSITQKEALMNL